MSADGDFYRTMQWAVLSLQATIERVDLSPGEIVDLFDDAAEFAKLANEARTAELAGSEIDDADWARSNELFAKFSSISGRNPDGTYTSQSDNYGK